MGFIIPLVLMKKIRSLAEQEKSGGLIWELHSISLPWTNWKINWMHTLTLYSFELKLLREDKTPMSRIHFLPERKASKFYPTVLSSLPEKFIFGLRIICLKFSWQLTIWIINCMLNIFVLNKYELEIMENNKTYISAIKQGFLVE